MIRELTQSGLYLETQLDALQDRGYARERALEQLGLSSEQFDDPRLRVPLDDAVRLYEDAEKVLDCPTIGLETGYAFRVSNFAKTGRIYMYCANLSEIIAMNARYQRLAIHAGEVSDLQVQDGYYLDFRPFYDDPNKYRHITDLIFGAYGTAFRWLNWGSGKSNKAVSLRHDLDGDEQVYERILGCPVSFGSAHDRIEFHPELRDMPLPTSDPERLILIRERLDHVLEDIAHQPDALEAALRAAIRTCLRKGQASLGQAAAQMGRTERQLRSELSKSKLSFRTVLADVRKELFRFRRTRGESYADIAQALGYSDQAAFNRAFKRWYGKAPGQIDMGAD